MGKGAGGDKENAALQIEYVITDMIILQHWISRQNISYTKEDNSSFC